MLDAFPPGMGGQTNQSLAMLNLPVAFRYTTVFNVNEFLKRHSNDPVYLFWCRRLAKTPEPFFWLLFDFVSNLRVFTGLQGPGHPAAHLPLPRSVGAKRTPGPGHHRSSEEGDCRIYQPSPRDLRFHLFLFPLHVQFVFSRPKQFLMYSILPA